MPMHKGLIPREGFILDVVIRLVRSTVLNPSLILPLVLFARFTKKGQDLSILHPSIYQHLRNLLCIGLVRVVSNWFSRRALNNWVDDQYDWSREIVLITGGAGGIGGEMVKLFDEKGITVVVLDIQPMTFATSSKVHHFHCDIRSPQNISDVADQIRSQVGHPTVVINNAGVARGKTVMRSDPADVRFTFDVNTLAPFYMARAFLPHMINRDHGMFVIVSSMTAWMPLPNLVDYGASKAGSLCLHEGLAAELKVLYKAPRVRTVVVLPAHARTGLFRGFDQGPNFFLPSVFPETVAESVVRKVLSGTSGSVVIPESGLPGAALRAMPDWLQIGMRASTKQMEKFSGHQVIKDVGASYEDDKKPGCSETSESTVLVSAE